MNSTILNFLTIINRQQVVHNIYCEQYKMATIVYEMKCCLTTQATAMVKKVIGYSGLGEWPQEWVGDETMKDNTIPRSSRIRELP